MDKETRNGLRNIVVQSRKILEEDLLDQLEGAFGIHRNGTIESEGSLSHLNEEELDARRRAVAAVEHIEGYDIKPKDAVDQFQREVAFTHLNRLCAFKMLERRGLLDETVSRGTNSNGFKVHLAEHREDERLWRTGEEYRAYKHFLFDVCAKLTDEIKVLFDTEHISSHLFPGRKSLEGVLDLINADELADIWESDETIGWIYQYFTPKELRDKARKESAAPRNSYELAFRNQFYTPRYVVQFLTDNTLGRTWYEMRKGDTRLVDQCGYMVRRPMEIFLGLGQALPPEPQDDSDLSQEELLKQPVHILHREKKLPWEIKVLDPASGSGHFLRQLRTGAKDNPTMRHLEALARFFGVSPAYFFDDHLTELPGVEDRPFVASSRHTLREVAMNLIGLSEGSLNAVLQLSCRLREIEGLTCAENQPGVGDGASQASNPGSTTRRKRSVRKKAHP